MTLSAVSTNNDEAARELLQPRVMSIKALWLEQRRLQCPGAEQGQITFQH